MKMENLIIRVVTITVNGHSTFCTELLGGIINILYTIWLLYSIIRFIKWAWNK